MTKLFTDDNFKGYEFRCETTSANIGFKHVCRVFDSNNNEVDKAKSVINWGNRTWESFPYQSVLNESKNKLESILNNTDSKKQKINTDFLYKLVEHGYISEYGLFGDSDDEYVILFDSWDDVEGHDEREYVEGQGMVKTGKYIKSVYAKLVDLANQDRLKDDISYTLLNTDYVFTDEYALCYDCMHVYNINYDLTITDDGLYCDNCLNENTSIIEDLIYKAKDDFRAALKPTVNQDTIESMGYTLVTDDTFSFEREFWGATYVDYDFITEFTQRYNGFVQIYEVAQFVTPFQIWIPNELVDEARNELIENGLISEELAV